MEYVLIQREGFKEEFVEQIEMLNNLSSEELIARYNRQVEIGIVGVYKQAIFLVALRWVFKSRFNQSPILVEANIIVSITNCVQLINGTLIYLNGEVVKSN
jgi:hypothetical protein